MATEKHSPHSRGYDTWLGYWHHSNDYWTQNIESCSRIDIKDMWRYNETVNGPAYDLVNGPSCSQENQHPIDETCVYEDDIFLEEIKNIITSHDVASDVPLFLFYSMHLVHMPLQAKQNKLDQFAFINDMHRREMHAMVNTVDDYIGEVIDTLKSTQLWNDSLVVIHSDNGGEIMTEFCGGNNYPLRGGKFSNFEGGIRVNAVVSGGYLPERRRGKKETGLMSIADWYATYATIAGVKEENIVDMKAAAANLPPIDSKNCWPLIAGTATSCRTEIPFGDTSAIGFNMDGDALVGALIMDKYKILLGAVNKGFHVDQDVVTGVLWPNVTSILIPELHPKVCNRDALNGGCLFDIYADPSESNNIAKENSELFYQMLARVDELQANVFSPDRGFLNEEACKKAIENNYYWGPFLEV